jgi:hypothetical protein
MNAIEGPSIDDVHAATEELGKPFRFLPCGGSNPSRVLYHGLFGELEGEAPQLH